MPDDARLISHLNDLLAATGTWGSVRAVPSSTDNFPHLHILGPPRSGTTLLMQVLAAGTNLRYVDNIAARFWSAPELGIALSREVLRGRVVADFTSHYGQTTSPSGPHEFSYFWQRWLGSAHLDARALPGAPSELADLRGAVRQLVMALGGPSVFKTSLPFHASEFAQICPEAHFVAMRRNTHDLAASILRVRRDPAGPYARWFSLRPGVEISEGASLHEQVALQAVALERHFSQQAQSVGADRWREVEYDHLCISPRETAQELVYWLVQDEAAVSVELIPPDFIAAHGFGDLLKDDQILLDRHIAIARRLVAPHD